MMSQVRISSDRIKYDLYDVIQVMSDNTWLVQLSGSNNMYWLWPNTDPTRPEPYVRERMGTHEIRYVYVKSV
jgi:hypothetical protein